MASITKQVALISQQSLLVFSSPKLVCALTILTLLTVLHSVKKDKPNSPERNEICL